MLVGVWRPVRGKVRIDGAALDQWSHDALGQHIGYLPQDVELFSGTVAQNIARFEEDADPSLIIAAAKNAGVHELIVNLPEGYDTEVGENGSALSSGQAQRVGLARALYRDPFLVVLDEPNANLDSEGDEALTAAITGVRKRGGIVVVVAHRPSAIAAVDLILVMNKGRVHHFGPKEEALAKAAPRPARRVRCRSCLKSGERHESLAAKADAIAEIDQPSRRSRRTARCPAGRRRRRLGRDVGNHRRGDRRRADRRRYQRQEGPASRPAASSANCNVRDGDRVKAGDVVVRLDDTITRANLAIVTKGLNELAARKARLEAERDGLTAIKFPTELTDQIKNPDVAAAVASESKLFEARRVSRDNQRSQLRNQISELGEQITGFTAQQEAKQTEIALIQRELEGVRDLFKKNLVQLSRLTQLEREAARLEGERGQFIASIAQSKVKISDTELQIISIDQDLASDVGKELREIDGKIGEFVERKVTAEDQLKRVDIRAPQDGTVFQSAVHTVGGVITAGEPIMLVVPEADNLAVEAKANPAEIDQLQIGQRALLRFTNFNQRTTPEIYGAVTRISADISTDQRSGASYYTIRVGMPADRSREARRRQAGARACRSKPSFRPATAP